MTFIYCLAEPRSGEIRYVGKADDPELRLARHLRERYPCHKTTWLQSLKAKTLKPLLVLLEECEEENWQERERHWISFLRESGADLVNGTDGGEGTSGAAEEVRIAAVRARKGYRHSPETREKIRQAALSRRHTDETRQKLKGNQSALGYIWTEEMRTRQSIAMRGNQNGLGHMVTAEAREKMTGRPPQHKRKEK